MGGVREFKNINACFYFRIILTSHYQDVLERVHHLECIASYSKRYIYPIHFLMHAIDLIVNGLFVHMFNLFSNLF